MQRKRAIWLGTIAGTSMVVGGLMWPIRQARQQEANRNRLFRAIQTGDPKGLAFLVATGCDPNARNKQGHTALTLARLYHHPAMFQALRKAGAVR